jgi:hypothetical protein
VLDLGGKLVKVPTAGKRRLAKESPMRKVAWNAQLMVETHVRGLRG